MQGDCGGLFIASPLENQIQRINATHMEHLLAGNCFTISESRRCACRYSSRRDEYCVDCLVGKRDRSRAKQTFMHEKTLTALVCGM